MLTIPVLDVQKQLDDDYRDQIELFSCKVADLEDTHKVLRDINDRLTLRNEELNNRYTSNMVSMNERNFAVARCTSLESDVKRLEADLKTEISNRDHFRALVAQQDAFIKEAKRQIEEFKAKKERSRTQVQDQRGRTSGQTSPSPQRRELQASY